MLTTTNISLNAFGASDTGQEREHNEDRFYCDPERGIFIAIDGVGGYAAGEVAASVACDLISWRLRQGAGTAEERLRDAITTANNEIYRRSKISPALYGMACVLTAVVIEGETVTVGHVGDTRLYEVHTHGLCKITHDHSPVGIREDAGKLSEIEAMRHPRRSEILRDVGSEWHDLDDTDFIDIYTFDFSPDTALLLCTDGLTDLVPQVPIHQILLDHAGHPELGVQTLIELANEVGGHDNITAIVVEGPEFEKQAHGPVFEELQSTPVSIDEGLHRPMTSTTSPMRSKPAIFLYGVLVGCVLAMLPVLAAVVLLQPRMEAYVNETASTLNASLETSLANSKIHPVQVVLPASDGHVIPPIIPEELNSREPDAERTSLRSVREALLIQQTDSSAVLLITFSKDQEQPGGGP